jgi:hypothetical protein
MKAADAQRLKRLEEKNAEALGGDLTLDSHSLKAVIRVQCDRVEMWQKLNR